MADGTPDYGTALSCVVDIDPSSRTVTGNRVIGEALARRLFTPRGRLIGYPNYGYDLTQFVNADLSARDLAGIRIGIEAECLKDERVAGVEVDVVKTADDKLLVTILVEGSKGPFKLVLQVSEVTIAILEVSP